MGLGYPLEVKHYTILAVSKLQLFAASRLKSLFSKWKLVLVLPVSQIPVMSA